VSVFIEYIDKMDMRHLIETSQNPTTFSPVLRNIKDGNTFRSRRPKGGLDKEVSGADIRVVAGRGGGYLYFVDSYGA
jgi:hypothetical protein